MFNVFVIFKDTKKEELKLESSFQLLIFIFCILCHLLIIGNRRFSRCLSIPMFIGTLCRMLFKRRLYSSHDFYKCDEDSNEIVHNILLIVTQLVGLCTFRLFSTRLVKIVKISFSSSRAFFSLKVNVFVH